MLVERIEDGIFGFVERSDEILGVGKRAKKRKAKKSAKKWVFAVHNWETGDGYHHVTFGTNHHTTTKRFRKWSKAEQFARSKAKALGLRSYQIDHPSKPHKTVRVSEAKKPRRQAIALRLY